MQEQDIKRGHFQKIEGPKLGLIAREVFGEGAVLEGDQGKILVRYGALDPLTVWTDGKKRLYVDTKMKTDVDEEVAAETIRRYNMFMEKATGYTSSERRKRLNEKAKKGKL